MSLNNATGQLIVAHERIAGFMPAMTMPYKVAGTTSEVHPGDQISATLVVDNETEWLENLRVTRKAPDGFMPLAAPAAAVLGTEVPDFPPEEPG